MLQQDTRHTSEEIGAAVGLSATAVQRRLKRLRESGAIRREIAVLDPAALGGRITLIVTLKISRAQPQEIDALKQRMRTLPEVQQCYHTMGESDFVLIVTAKDVEAYEAFTQRAFYDDPNITHFTSNLAMESVKVGLSFPIEA